MKAAVAQHGRMRYSGLIKKMTVSRGRKLNPSPRVQVSWPSSTVNGQFEAHAVNVEFRKK